MNEIYAEMIVLEPNVMNFDLSRPIEHFWYNLLYILKGIYKIGDIFYK